MSVEELVERVAPLKTAFTHSAESKRLLREVLVTRPKAELGKKPPLSAPASPPLPLSVKETMARPLLAPAAKVGNSISSCIAEMYDWLVRLNFPVWSKLRVPTTQ